MMNRSIKKISLYTALSLFVVVCLALSLNKYISLSQKRDRVVVAMITDDNYALPTGVAITSIRHNKKKETDLKIYVIGHNLSDENKRLLSKTKCILMEDKLDTFLDQATIGQNRKTALLKFNLPNIFSQEEKILYLDSDMIIQKDLAELFNIDIQDRYAAVVFDPQQFTKWRKEELGIKNYFNSGMMLLNLKKMRNENTSQKLIDYKLKTGTTPLSDQDAFNVVFNDNVIFLPIKYNWLVSWKRHLKRFGYSENDFENAVIIHEAGIKKSWETNKTLSYNLWQQYYEQSPFKGVKRD